MYNICIYEDNQVNELHPLVFLRPVYDLLVGMDSIYQKYHRYFGGVNVTLHCRDHLKPITKNLCPGVPVNRINEGAPCLFINGRVIPNDAFIQKLDAQDTDKDFLITSSDQVVALRLSQDNLVKMTKLLDGTPDSKQLIKLFRASCVTSEIETAQLLTNPWDILNLNAQVLKQDFDYKNQRGIIKGDVKSFVSIYNENNVFIDKKTVIEDFVLINAEKGPVYIEEGVQIKAGSRIEGPVFLGKNTQVQSARITNTSVGQHCKVGGEVSSSVIHSFSNKGHEGYLGNSYIGKWVNLGALTTTSNLKNTYGTISLLTPAKTIQTDQQFLGSLVGDHVKTGIGTLLNTGTIIEFGSIIHGAAVHAKYIPPFTWGSAGNYKKVDPKALLTIAERMMSRRGILLKEEDKEIILSLYKTHTK